MKTIKQYLFKIFTLFILGFSLSLNSDAQVLMKDFPITDAQITNLSLAGDTLFIMGDFTRIYSPDSSSKNCAVMNPVTGAVYGNWPKPNSFVNSMISDNHGGYFWGGHFTMLGDSVRNGLAHIDATGRVTAKLRDFNSNGTIQNLAIKDDSLYVSGNFTNAGNVKSGDVFVINPNNGSTQKIFRLQNSDYSIEYSSITSCIPDGSGGLFILGGSDFFYRGYSIKNFMRVDSNGMINQNWFLKPSSNILCMLISGDTLFLGGGFSKIAGQNRNCLSAFSISTGALLNLNYNITGNSVSCMALSGNKIFIGGSFFNAGDSVRNRIAAIDRLTGKATAFNPNAISTVSKILVAANNTIYVCGEFYIIGGLARNKLAALDGTTGLATNWNPNPNGSVADMAFGANTLYVCGGFTQINGQARNKIAELSLSAASNTSWNPILNATGNSISNLIVTGNWVYASGNFYSSGSEEHINYAAINRTSGNLSSFSTNLDYNSQVYSQVAVDSFIYIAGNFHHYGGDFHKYLLCLNLQNEEIIPQNYNFPNGINKMLLKDSLLYFCGGYFNYTPLRQYFAAINIYTGNYSNWDPSPDAPVTDFDFSGDTIFAVGDFLYINGVARKGIAAIHKTNNLTFSGWNANSNNALSQLVRKDNLLYVYGNFTSIGGQSRSKLAAISTQTALSSSWNPPTYWGGLNVSDLTINDTTLYLIGGGWSGYTTIGGKVNQMISALSTITGLASDFSCYPQIDQGGGFQLFYSDNILFANTRIILGGKARKKLAAINTQSFNVLPFNPNPIGNVYSVAISGNTVYAAGNFGSIGGAARTKLAALDLNTGNALSFNPFFTADINTILLKDSILYVAGQFSSVSAQPRNKLCSFNIITGNLTSWNPGVSGTIKTMAASENKLFVGGNFTYLSGTYRQGTGSFDLKIGSLNNWYPAIDLGPVNSIIYKKGSIFMGGTFININNNTTPVARKFIAQVDTISGLALNWDASADAKIVTLAIQQDKIFAGGDFSNIGSKYSKKFGAVNILTATQKDWYCFTDTIGNTNYTPTINAITANEKQVFIAGNFNQFNLISSAKYIAVFNKEFYLDETTIPSKFCGANYSFNIAVITSLNLNPINVFIAQLSDSSGSFNTPVNIGSISSPVSCNLPVQIPPGTPNSVKYNIRVISNYPNYEPYTVSRNLSIYKKPVVAFTVNQLNQCLTGNQFVFTDTVSSNSSSAKRTWNLGDSSSNSQVTVSKIYVAANQYNIKLLITDTANGCADSAFKIIGVFAKPIAIINYTSPTTFCEGDSILLNATTGNNYTYEWFRNNTKINTATGANYPVKLSGDYFVVVKNAAGCADTSTHILITIIPKPKAGYTTGILSQCLSNNIFSFMDTSSFSMGTYTRMWVFGDSTFSTLPNPQKTYLHADSFMVKLVITAINGCKDSLSQKVFVNANPMATATIISSPPFCQGDSIRLNANTGTDLSYQWKNNGITITGANANNYKTTTGGSIKVIVTNRFDCFDSSSAVNVIINSKPSAGISTIGPTSFCQGGNTVLQASTGVGLTYVWKNNGIAITGAINANYLATANGNYKVIESNSFGCMDSSSSINVVVYALPEASLIAGGPTTLCQGDSLIIHANTGTGLIYQWRNNGLSIPNATGSNYVTRVNGSYSIVISNTYSCVDTSNTIVVIVNSLPVATALAAGPTTFCQGGNVTINANTGTGLTYKWRNNGLDIPGANGSSYIAQVNGGYRTIVTNTNSCVDSSSAVVVSVYPNPVTSAIIGDSIVIRNEIKTYSVTNTPGSIYHWMYTNGSGNNSGSSINITWTGIGITLIKLTETSALNCNGDTVVMTVLINSSSGNFEISNDQNITIYPNPFDDEINLILHQKSLSSFKAEVFDVAGRKILEKEISYSETRIDLSSIYAEGIYFLKVQDQVFKLLKN